jgi:hypothetical protein
VTNYTVSSEFLSQVGITKEWLVLGDSQYNTEDGGDSDYHDTTLVVSVIKTWVPHDTLTIMKLKLNAYALQGQVIVCCDRSQQIM